MQLKKVPVYLSVLILIGLFFSCKDSQEFDISGAWIYESINQDSIIEPLKTFYPTSHPTIPEENFHDVIYIDSKKIDHPLMRPKNDFSIQGKYTYYKFKGGKIILNRDGIEYEYDIRNFGNRLCLEQGKFCLTRLEEEHESIDSTIFRFEVSQEFGHDFEFWMNHNYMSDQSICTIRYPDWPNENALDTIDLSDEIKAYIVTMLERIPENQLNRIYNNGLSDCTEYSIDFYNANGMWKGIETCSSIRQNPFEIRVLTTNMYWILISYLREERE